VPSHGRCKHAGKGDDSESAVWVHGTRADAAGVVGLVRCARHESGGSRLRCVLDASATAPSECSIIPGVADEAMSGSEMVAAAAYLDLLVNVFVDGVPGSYRAIPTSVRHTPTQGHLPLPLLLFFSHFQ
jgi:hypothetical protein